MLRLSGRLELRLQSRRGLWRLVRRVSELADRIHFGKHHLRFQAPPPASAFETRVSDDADTPGSWTRMGPLN